MFCHKCGNQLVENSEFCNKCGAKSTTQATVAAEPTPTVTPTPTVAPVQAVAEPAPQQVQQPTNTPYGEVVSFETISDSSILAKIQKLSLYQSGLKTFDSNGNVLNDVWYKDIANVKHSLAWSNVTIKLNNGESFKIFLKSPPIGKVSAKAVAAKISELWNGVQETTVEPSPTAEKKSKKKWAMIGGACIASVALALALIFVIVPTINKNKIRTVTPTVGNNDWGEIENGRVGLSIPVIWHYQIEPLDRSDISAGYEIRILDHMKSLLLEAYVYPTKEEYREDLAMLPVVRYDCESPFAFNDGNIGIFCLSGKWINYDTTLQFRLYNNSLIGQFYNQTGGFGALQEVITDMAKTLTAPKNK